ncbi:Mn2+/Fe2+ NRAMP family transporter [Bradyrhizobium elkanii]
MADAAKLVIGGTAIVYVVTFAVISVLAQIFIAYKRYVTLLKWLALVLFAYVIALAVVKVTWTEALKGLLVPKIEWSGTFLTTLVAILRTTILPYLFIWQSSQEAEEQRIHPDKKPLEEDTNPHEREFWRIRIDPMIGMAFSNLIAIAIIITTAATLHQQGVTDVQSSAQAAAALKPIAGPLAELVFALGIIGTGLLAVPVLAHRRRP